VFQSGKTKLAEAIEGVLTFLKEHLGLSDPRQVDRESTLKFGTMTQLLDLAQRDIARNDVAGAKAALAKAYRLVQKQIDDVKRGAVPASQLPFAASDLSHIISAYIKLGAFDEAVNASEPLAHIDRPFYLWEVVDAEVRRHDDVALKKTLPGVISKMASENYKADGNLVGVATILARGGYVNEAHKALQRAQELAEEGQNGYSVAGLREQIAIALAAMDDVADARALLQSGTQPGRNANLLPVVQELTNDGRFEQVSQICRELSELETRTCAGALETTVIKHSEAGNIPGAMAAAWQIMDPTIRADAMVRILKAIGQSKKLRAR
jgi:tetratricopeptide (TPR) repeat protein